MTPVRRVSSRNATQSLCYNSRDMSGGRPTAYYEGMSAVRYALTTLAQADSTYDAERERRQEMQCRSRVADWPRTNPAKRLSL